MKKKDNPDISPPLQTGGSGHDGEDPGLDWGQGGGAGQTRAPGSGPGESGDRSGEQETDATLTFQVSSLATPMCVLSLLEMMEGVGWSREGLAQDCIEVQHLGSIHEDKRFIKEIMSHVSGERVLETVARCPGQQVEGVAGRLVNPGHDIECGWFLLDWARK